MLEPSTERRSAATLRSRLIDFVGAWVSTSALFLTGLLLPVGGTLLLVLTPQPGLRLGQRRPSGTLAVLIALVAATAGFAGGVGPAVAYLATFGLMTLALPAVLRREWSIEVTVGAATSLVALAVLAALLFVASPVELMSGFQSALEAVREEALAMYARAGLSPDVAVELKQASVRVVELVSRLAPAVLMMSIAGAVLVNVLLLRWRQRLVGEPTAFGDLTRWKCPAELVWLLIVSGYGLFLPPGPVETWALNVFGVVLAVYFCQGLVIAQFYLRRWRSPFWVSGLLYVFILVEWLLAAGVTLIGVFDQWADFRRLNPRAVEED